MNRMRLYWDMRATISETAKLSSLSNSREKNKTKEISIGFPLKITHKNGTNDLIRTIFKFSVCRHFGLYDVIGWSYKEDEAEVLFGELIGQP